MRDVADGGRKQYEEELRSCVKVRKRWESMLKKGEFKADVNYDINV